MKLRLNDIKGVTNSRWYVPALKLLQRISERQAYLILLEGKRCLSWTGSFVRVGQSFRARTQRAEEKKVGFLSGFLCNVNRWDLHRHSRWPVGFISYNHSYRESSICSIALSLMVVSGLRKKTVFEQLVISAMGEGWGQWACWHIFVS